MFDCLKDMETLENFFVLSRKPVLTFYDYIVLEYVPVLKFGRMLLEIFRKVSNYFVLMTTHLSPLLRDVRLLERRHLQEEDHSGGLETR